MAATVAVERWQKENLRRTIRDKEGFEWLVRVEMSQALSNSDLRQTVYRVKLWLEEDATVDQLISTGVLSRTNDARLINLLDRARVPFALRPVEFTAQNLDEARNVSLATVEMIAKKMQLTPLVSTKKALIWRFIDSASAFGSFDKRL